MAIYNAGTISRGLEITEKKILQAIAYKRRKLLRPKSFVVSIGRTRFIQLSGSDGQRSGDRFSPSIILAYIINRRTFILQK